LRPRPPAANFRHRPHAATDLFSNEWVRLAFLVLLASTIFFSKLGLNGMANFDDCFYAEKAKEMLQSGNWGTQTFDHVVQFGNAPLHLWLVALSYKAFGVSVYAAKFPSALMALFTVLLTYFLGRYLFDSWTGFAAGFVLSTTYTFFKYARHCMLDLTLAFFCTLALAALVLAMRKNRNFFWLWGLSIGLAFLTKSALGLFPLIVTLLFIAIDRQWKVLTWLSFWGGLFLQLAIMAGWCYSQYRIDGPKFLDEHLKGVILEKAYMGDTPNWYQHFSFLTDMLMFNWLWLLPMVWGLWLLVKKAKRDHSTALFILLWALTLPVVMSLARYRMPWYLMQVFPALALAAAVALGEFLSDWNKKKWTKGLILAGTAVVILVNALPYPLDRDREKDTRLVAPYVKHFADKGAKVVGLRDDFYGLNNSMLFFSDHAAQPIYSNVSDIEKEFEAPGVVLCVAHRGDMADIQKGVKQWYPVRYGDDLVLLSNRQLDTTDVRTDCLN
jgi:4-amino-4-deoxy-L-arabinose transferase-like glycosyltransferase